MESRAILKEKMQQQFKNLSPDEIDAAMILVDMRAEKMGMATDEWIKEYLADIVKSGTTVTLNQSQKAAVEFLEDGKALIHVTDRSDFSSFVAAAAKIEILMSAASFPKLFP